MTKFQFPDASEKAIQYFVQAFYSALHGIAPACSPFKKQKIAMEKAGIYVKFEKKEFISFPESMLNLKRKNSFLFI